MARAVPAPGVAVAEYKRVCAAIHCSSAGVRARRSAARIRNPPVALSNDSMLTSMMAVDNIVEERADKTNLWDVNLEMSYHEEKKS